MDINIYLINTKTNIFLEKCISGRKKSWYFFDFRSDPELDPDPFFHEADTKIRIHIKMKRIRNTAHWLIISIGTSQLITYQKTYPRNW